MIVNHSNAMDQSAMVRAMVRELEQQICQSARSTPGPENSGVACQKRILGSVQAFSSCDVSVNRRAGWDFERE